MVSTGKSFAVIKDYQNQIRPKTPRARITIQANRSCSRPVCIPAESLPRPRTLQAVLIHDPVDPFPVKKVRAPGGACRASKKHGLDRLPSRCCPPMPGAGKQMKKPPFPQTDTQDQNRADAGRPGPAHFLRGRKQRQTRHRKRSAATTFHRANGLPSTGNGNKWYRRWGKSP